MDNKPGIMRADAIKRFLTAKTHADLARLYSIDMECQVNVAQDGGDRIEGEFRGRQWHGWTDGVQVWKSFRIPRNASTSPEYEDSELRFDLEAHAEGIGMTGWNWKTLQSKWVAFDFDAITGHSKGNTQADLENLKAAAQEIPWVTIRKSTGGKGLHIYVFLEEGIHTATHTEHAALARAILGNMAALTGFEFAAKVDICGGNMWVWHRKMAGSGGLELLKSASELCKEPPNWRDHVKVITGHRKKALPTFVNTQPEEGLSEIEQLFSELTGQAVRIPLDSEHKRIIKYLMEDKATQSWWDADNHMLVTHTFHLKEAHTELGLKGMFDTNALGKEAGRDHNCFAFPLRRGAWAVRRYSLGVQEHPYWDQDGKGWTRCFYNLTPDLATAAKTYTGIEHPSGGFMFREAEMASDAARQLGAQVPDIPPALRAKRAKLKQHKDGRLIFEIDGDPDAIVGNEMQGWLHDHGVWKRIFNMQASSPTEIETGNNYDDFVRHIVTSTGEDYGWVIKGEGDQWRYEPLQHVKTALESLNIGHRDIKNILGSSVIKCWQLVNLPFQPEYPGGRRWNQRAAQLRYVPTLNRENLKYETWTKILKHCGAGLDEAIASNPWAKANGILSGADYLKIWISSLFKEPLQPLPYLFFYGPQNSGKSIFHEALSLLITSGYRRADAALINPQGFNGELEGSIICVVEEVSLKKSKDANNRIKDWVTARDLPVHHKGKTPYHVPNTTHWIQCSNDINACPVFPGDTRITMMYVPPLDQVSEMIPKKQLIPMLEREAPDFLAEIMALEIPPSNDRLNVPVITTAEKLETERANRSPLEMFLQEKCFEVPGKMISVADFYEKFQLYCDPDQLGYWTKIKVGREMPPHFPKGRSRMNGHHYFGNISFSPPIPGENLPRLKAITDNKDVFLVPDGNDKGHSR